MRIKIKDSLVYFFLIFGLAAYFFYLLSDLNLKSLCIDLPNNYFKKTAHLEKIGFSKDLKDIKINEKIKNKQYKVVNLLRIFNSLNYPKKVNSNNCLVFENKTLWWTADSDSFFPIKINNRFILKMNFKKIKGYGGIELIGSYGKDDKNWWIGAKSISIFYDEKNKLIIDVKINKPEPIKVFEIIGLNKDLDFYFRFDLLDNRIIIYDDKFRLVKKINLGSEFKKNFLLGDNFFNNYFYLGYVLGPNSAIEVCKILAIDF
jgi:hypothetical protein